MALPAATFTGQQIVTAVSRFAGLANDTNSRPAVLDMVNAALWEVSLQTPWTWNEVINTDITVTAGVADNPLPTGAGLVFDEVYDVRLVGSGSTGPERTLLPLDLRSYDRTRAGVQTGTSTPTHYYIYGPQNNAVLTLVPTPNNGNTLRIRYIARQNTLSDASGSALSVPDKYVPMIVYKAASLTLAWKAPERASYWEVLYQKALMRGLQMSREMPDETPGMVPRNQNGVYYDPLYPDDLHEYSR